MAIGRVFTALLCLAWGTSAAAQADTALITQARRTPVRSLDSTLSGTSVSEWIARLRTLPSSRIHWEVNDCGEGGDGRAAPTCVEVILDLAPDTTASLSQIVRDIAGQPVAPAIFLLNATIGRTVIPFKTLAQWAEFVRAR